MTFFTFLIGKYGFQVTNGKLDPILENAVFVKESIYVYITQTSHFNKCLCTLLRVLFS